MFKLWYTITVMKKNDALKEFNGNCAELGRALGKTRAAISKWPKELTDEQINLVVGISYRLGKNIPDEVLIKKR